MQVKARRFARIIIRVIETINRRHSPATSDPIKKESGKARKANPPPAES